MYSRKKSWLWLLVVVVLFVSNTANGETAPVDTQADYLLRAIAFDRNLEKRAADGIRIAVIYKDNPEDITPIVDTFNEKGEKGVKGLSVSAMAIKFKSVSDLIKQVDKEKINAVYIDPSLGTLLNSIHQVTRGQNIVTGRQRGAR